MSAGVTLDRPSADPRVLALNLARGFGFRAARRPQTSRGWTYTGPAARRATLPPHRDADPILPGVPMTISSIQQSPCLRLPRRTVPRHRDELEPNVDAPLVDAVVLVTERSGPHSPHDCCALVCETFHGVLTASRLLLDHSCCLGVGFDVPPDGQGRKSSRRVLNTQYSPVVNPQKFCLRVPAASVPA